MYVCVCVCVRAYVCVEVGGVKSQSQCSCNYAWFTLVLWEENGGWNHLSILWLEWVGLVVSWLRFIFIDITIFLFFFCLMLTCFLGLTMLLRIKSSEERVLRMNSSVIIHINSKGCRLRKEPCGTLASKVQSCRLKKTLINDRLHVSKVSWKFRIPTIYNVAIICP